MAKALPAGRPVRRRPMFGLFDPDGWGWATMKASFWLLVLIMALGYIPDRAYYFVVSRTIDIGILGWSPVNLCPPENGPNMPCPVPAGGIVPWGASGAEAALPEPRTQGAAAQLGKNLLYIGGSDGSAPTATTYLAEVEGATFGAWSEGPALPEARANAGIAILSGTAYLVGGLGPDGQPTDTVWSIGLDPDTSALGTWRPLDVLTLPEARAGVAAVAVTDGILVAGGIGPDGNPTGTVWKSTLDSAGALGAFQEQPSLTTPVTDASAALEGTFLWVYGGSDANGPTAVVQRADYGVASTATGSAPPGAPSTAPQFSPTSTGATGPVATGTGAAPSVNPTAGNTGGAPGATGGAPASPGATGEGASPAPAASPGATAAPPASTGAPASSPSASGGVEGVVRWVVEEATNLPAPRTGGASWAANGALYIVGGSDATSAKRELYWALPDANGNLPGGWRHLEQTDLPEPVVDAAALVTGSNVVVLGGTDTDGQPLASSYHASLAPEEPFFQLGLVGVVVPALQIGGEIGQQLGYLAAAGVGTGNFVILVAIAAALNHKAQLRAWWERRRAAREAKAG